MKSSTESTESGNTEGTEDVRTSGVFARMPRLVPIEVDQVASVREAASRDGHALLLPTHAVIKDGTIVGAFSVEAWTWQDCPVVTMWLHSTRVKARESLGLINTVENLVFARGFEEGVVLVERSSPFFGVMPALGYREEGERVLVVDGDVEFVKSWDIELMEAERWNLDARPPSFGWPVVVFWKGRN